MTPGGPDAVSKISLRRLVKRRRELIFWKEATRSDESGRDWDYAKAASSARTRWPLGTAPTIWSLTWPPLMMSRLGIPRTP